MILRGETRQSLTGAGFLAVVGMGVLLLPLMPTVGRTQQPQANRPVEEKRTEERREGDARRAEDNRRSEDLARARKAVQDMEVQFQKMRSFAYVYGG